MVFALREGPVRDLDAFGAYRSVSLGVRGDSSRPASSPGINAGDTVIWPDDAFAAAGAVFLTDPVKLEQMLAG